MTKDKNTYQVALVVESAENRLNVVRLTLMRALEEVGKYQQTFTEESDLAKKADILNWTINYRATQGYTQIFGLICSQQRKLI